jgi:hypothetical protein
MTVKLCAAIVETRFFEDMVSTFQNHVPHLPENTEYFIFTDDKYINQYSSLLPNVNVLPVTLMDNTVHGYNMLLTHEDGQFFWKHFTNYDKILIFQRDSGLLRNGIEEFYEYDFVGAPLPTNHPVYYPFCCNGGLSLRTPEIMLEVLNRFKWEYNKGEDVFFCEKMHDFNIGKLAPRDVASQFSVETIFQLGTLGYHKPLQYLSTEQFHQIKTQYNTL